MDSILILYYKMMNRTSAIDVNTPNDFHLLFSSETEKLWP